jgi:hypothetical protein
VSGLFVRLAWLQAPMGVRGLEPHQILGFDTPDFSSSVGAPDRSITVFLASFRRLMPSIYAEAICR